QLPGGLAEIALRCRLDAIGAGPEIDPVEIELENLGLGELTLEPDRQHGFLQLAPDRALPREEQIFGELLRDGRAALRDAAAQNIGDDGAGKADRIEAAVAVEAAVLDRDEGFRQMRRHVLEQDGGAVPLAA